jgi:hypothetical protein
MQIKTNPELERFFSRCKNNLTHEMKNEFLGLQVNPQNEIEIQEAMKEAGFAEFQGPRSSWPSLFISTEAFLKSPYHSHIHLDKIQDKSFRFTTETLASHELFSVSSIHPDPLRELNDWMTLRALDEPYKATFLYQGKEVWMLDAPSEANTMDPYATKAKGNVLTFGLGIGYFIYMAMLNPEVTSITVIEKSKAVIDLFEKYLLPQFPKNITLNIIEGDAFNFFDEEFMKDYDYTFVDIWQSNEDGFKLIQGLLEQYLPAYDQVDFWIESSCVEFIPALIYLTFDSMAHHRVMKHPDKMYQKVLKKINLYLESIDETVTEVDRLKTFMYDPEILRKIISQKI